ncbi:hypothetical protein JTB14_008714 [Gonioctena quinquepunctata]|nr:hypothetical protein JTB14_008714 [Gonioctena quinquepunctata]
MADGVELLKLEWSRSAKWSNDETFKFIELYQNEPAIWNPKNKHHKDKNAVNDAWKRIADAISIPVAELKKKPCWRLSV